MENKHKKKIVISAINLTNAGPLAILRDCLDYVSEYLPGSYDIVALVHDRALVKAGNIEYHAFPVSKSLWPARLYYEYIYFKRLSKKLKPYLWLSLHDITPNVESEIRAVYCHNPAPFYKFSIKEARMDYKFMLFNLFYRYLYMLNIRKNSFVIVQQDWLRERFAKLYRLKNIIVSYPAVNGGVAAGIPAENSRIRAGRRTFFYPAFPRVFKNLEVICEAAKMLAAKGTDDFEICLTIDGRENSYSRFIYKKYGSSPNIKFLGWMTREAVYDCYKRADYLIFPSKLETWGLPITEFKRFDKPILLADLEYAHETIGRYDKVKFFDPSNPGQLAGFMDDLMKNRLAFDPAPGKRVAPPFAANWKELFDILLSAKERESCVP